MTVSKPKNNNSPSSVRCPHKKSHKEVLRRSRAVDEEAKGDASAELAVVLLIKGWIHLQHTRKAVTFNRRNLRFFKIICPF